MKGTRPAVRRYKTRTCLRIAAEMLDVPTWDVPEELEKRLVRIDTLVQKSLGYWGVPSELRSRQVVAMIVDQWEREQE